MSEEIEEFDSSDGESKNSNGDEEDDFVDLETAKKRGLIPFFDFKNQFKQKAESINKSTPNTKSTLLKSSSTPKKSTPKNEEKSKPEVKTEDKGKWLTKGGQKVFVYKGKSYQGKFASIMAKNVATGKSSSSPSASTKKRKSESSTSTPSKSKKSKQITIDSDGEFE